MNDPWKHRSKGMKCATCMWYVAKDWDAPNQLGRCRRHAPVMSGYPVVFTSDWCGDHKLDETKTLVEPKAPLSAERGATDG